MTIQFRFKLLLLLLRTMRNLGMTLSNTIPRPPAYDSKAVLEPYATPALVLPSLRAESHLVSRHGGRLQYLSLPQGLTAGKADKPERLRRHPGACHRRFQRRDSEEPLSPKLVRAIGELVVTP